MTVKEVAAGRDDGRTRHDRRGQRPGGSRVWLCASRPDQPAVQAGVAHRRPARDRCARIDAIDDPAPERWPRSSEADLRRCRQSLANWQPVPSLQTVQHRHRGVVTTDPRHRAAAAGTRAAQHDSVVSGRHAPAPGRCVERLVVLGERPTQRAVEDVAAVMPSVCSRSRVVLVSMQGRPAESSISTS